MSDLAHQLGFKNIKDLYYDFRNNCRKGGYGFVPAEQKRLGPAGLDDVNYLINSGKDYEMILQKIIK